jgi:hypothetical protein
MRRAAQQWIEADERRMASLERRSQLNPVLDRHDRAPMTTYYCHPCAASRGYLSTGQAGTLLGSTTQLEKYMKHTCPSSSEATQSVFTNASTALYGSYVVSALCAGSVEVDFKGRTNIIWAAGEDIGFQFESGVLQHPQSWVKVVLSTDSNRIHAYSQSSTDFTGANCAVCAASIIH